MDTRKSPGARSRSTTTPVVQTSVSPAPDGEYAARDAWVSLIGGHPALDLVNTVSWRLDPARRTDRLATHDDLITWSTRAALIETACYTGLSLPSPKSAERTLTRVRALRENAYLALCDHLAGRPVDAGVLDTLRAALSSALRGAPAAPAFPLRLAVRPTDATQIPDAIEASLFDLFVLQDLARLRECQGTGCGWLYLDRSRNRSRRWCSSTDCGNRHRVHQFATRARSSLDTAASSATDAPSPSRPVAP
ncbi:CGNR zinc finger domain-containing protein [Kineosporia sp. J2-2]|uniref:CGNR zinc finger domain-containing protein n=1 Tax=Kineosporia corallincola TaxID=2835133 RepID=A0ABS5TJM0_9ACTN|nr:CGNR zinc finger domain-containing protein [Kineosporia corallincola]MBT0770263.1 CGNR zinc finger domain-containing protein [Kineosporia corallincola]